MSLLVIMLMFAPTAKAPNMIMQCTKIALEQELSSDIGLNDTELTNELIKQKCILPGCALAQFKVETGPRYTSSVCATYKNLGGIRFKIKGSRGIGFSQDSLHYVIYASYKDCIRDYVAIQNAYLKKIEGRYAADGAYTDVIRKVR